MTGPSGATGTAMSEPGGVNGSDFRVLVHLAQALVTLVVILLLCIGGLGLEARRELLLFHDLGALDGGPGQAFNDAQRSAQELAERQDAFAAEVGRVAVMMENVTGMEQALAMAARPLPIERSATSTPSPNATADAQTDREQKDDDRKAVTPPDAGHSNTKPQPK